MIKICAISGSLRRASSNTSLLRAATFLAPHSVKITLFEDMGNLPLFNPDLEGFEPGSVKEFQKCLQESDGVMIASPEYAYGITGTMKNALDWVVGSGEFVNKPVALINASSRATKAQESLKTTISVMMAYIVTEASVTIPLPHNKIDYVGILESPELSGKLKSAIIIFAKAISDHQLLQTH